MENNMDRTELLRQITAVNFMLEDLSLYLNTHPTDKNALIKYNSYILQAKSLKDHYQKHFGMLEEHGAASPYPWQWICEPWPWEYEANFKL